MPEVKSNTLWWECERKTRYDSLERAEQIAARRRAAPKYSKNIRRIAYPCPYCMGYPVGHLKLDSRRWREMANHDDAP